MFEKVKVSFIDLLRKSVIEQFLNDQAIEAPGRFANDAGEGSRFEKPRQDRIQGLLNSERHEGRTQNFSFRFQVSG